MGGSGLDDPAGPSVPPPFPPWKWGRSARSAPGTVYDKETGEVVDSKNIAEVGDPTAEYKLLGTDFYHTYVDIRATLQASNPFCEGNSIDGAFTMTVTRSGNYAILTGQHRKMSNHEIFLWVPATGRTTIVYPRSLASVACLFDIACPAAEMGGFMGDC